MKKAYCCHVLDSSLYSSQNPCDFCNKSNCLFSQAYEECYICKVGEQWCFLIPCPQSAQQCGWDRFACSHGRGKWSKQWIPDISCLQLMWGLFPHIRQFPKTFPVLPLPCGSRLTGTGEPNSCPSAHALLKHRASWCSQPWRAFHCFQWNKDFGGVF